VVPEPNGEAPAGRTERGVDSTARPVVSAVDVVSGYGDLQVLFGVDIEVYQGELVMIFGPNGSGKSTFLKTIAGVQPIWGGTVRIGGEDITDVSAQDRAGYGLGYVPQSANVFPNLSIDENLTIGSLAGDDDLDRRGEVLDLFPELADRLDQRASTLSGGQRQMLAMGRALMADPDALLIDEPSAGLAPSLVERAFGHITSIVEAGTAVLMVEQNVRAGLEIADWGYALDGGENRFTGPAAELLEDDQIRDLYMGR
jgi:branched-chain amino acid transport system ATP-binding protein